MNQRMLIESNPHQTRIGLLEDDRLTEIFVEQHRHRGLVGNIYKGRVTRVLPGMQAAFVDIGLERDAFLYVRDADADVEYGDERLDSGETPEDEELSIEDLVKVGQELTVQVVKDALPNKGARITTHVTLPGRYLVLLPTVRHLGVSRRIEDEVERTRLLAVLDELGAEVGGLIVRTAGEGEGIDEFSSDREMLSELWRRISGRANRVSAPTLLHRDHDLILRTMRDLLNNEFVEVLVEGPGAYEKTVEFLREVQPTLAERVQVYDDRPPLFERYGMESQIEAALRARVWLKSGGYLVINPTEALVAIDVNTGRYVGKSTLEETVLQTNLEAVREIVRQIRLRDLGGIIVVDLIDMVEEEHRNQVFGALEAEMAKDRARTKVLSISEFGLVEITRKRTRVNLERLLTEPCPYCRGRGRIKTMTTICLDLRRELLTWRDRRLEGDVLLRVHPEIARALQQEERDILEEVEEAIGATILVQSDETLHVEQHEASEA